MRNPAKARLIFSGLTDLVVAIFFGILIVFTLFFIISPFFNHVTPFSPESNLFKYDAMVANFFGGMSVFVATLYLTVGGIFLLGLIFSFSYVKLCFVIAKMNIDDASKKTSPLIACGVMQVIVGAVALAASLFILIRMQFTSSTQIVIILNAASCVAFVTSAALKLSSAKMIKDEAIRRHDLRYVNRPPNVYRYY